MIVGIDGSLLTGKRTGMANVLYNVLLELDNKENIQFILYVRDDIDQELYNNIIKKNFIIKKLKYYNYVVWEQILLPYHAKKDKIDVFWFPYNTGSIVMKCKKMVFIHDLIYMNRKEFKAPTLYKKLGKLYRRIIVPIIAKKSDKIITISNESKNEIINYFPKLENKIKIVYLGVSNKNEKLSDEEWKKYREEKNIKENYILSFGKLEPRKNTMTVIKVFEQLKDMQLVLVGFRNYEKSEEYEYIKNHDLKNICILEYVTDKELNSLYANSKLFMFISLKEGFGLPIIEAMQNNTLVLTSNISCMPEIGGDAAMYVDPLDIDKIKETIIELINNKELQIKLKSKYNDNFNKFNWKNTAKNVMDTINDI